MLRTTARFVSIALLVVLVAACANGTASPSTVTRSASSGAASPSAVASALPGPNAGHVLFGDSFDRATFVISGPATQVARGHNVAFVGHFTRRVPSGQIHLLVVLGGRTLVDRAIPVVNGPWSVYGANILGTKLTQSGVLLVRFTDDASALLSSGTLTITQGPATSPAASGSPKGSPAGSSPPKTSPPASSPAPSGPAASPSPS